MSQQALARVLGWSQSAVSRFERMLRPDQMSLVEIAQVACDAVPRVRGQPASCVVFASESVMVGVDVIVIVLGESAINRRLLPQLLEALGLDYATPPRVILGALRKGEPLPGSGVVLI